CHKRLSEFTNADVAGVVSHVVHLFGSSQMREEEPEHSISDIGVGPTGGTSAHHVDIPATNDICQEVRLYSTVVQGHSRAINVPKAKGECIDTVLGGIGRQRGFSDPFALGVAGPRREMLQCALSVFSDEICAFD